MNITKNTLEKVYKAKQASVDSMNLKGYTLVKELFVDSGGLGRDYEPALTQSQFKHELLVLLAEHGTLTAKITRAGMFQVYIGLFKRTGKAVAKKIANNTYRIMTPEGHKIRLHDTDILTFTRDTVTLENGGWQSMTTAKRMNAYMPNYYSVHQKNYEWFVRDARTGTTVPYVNGMTLPL